MSYNTYDVDKYIKKIEESKSPIKLCFELRDQYGREFVKNMLVRSLDLSNIKSANIIFKCFLLEAVHKKNELKKPENEEVEDESRKLTLK